MSEFEDKLDQLQTRLEHLEKYETAFKREIKEIQRQINLLKTKTDFSKDEIKQTSYTPPKVNKPIPKKERIRENKIPRVEFKEVEFEKEQTENKSTVTAQTESISKQAQANLERFIGENLISKIGIVILVIGVAIGGKYAIDNNLISPLMRIIFGYLVGFVLIGLAIKLKPKYHNYSAVLMSGGMAIMYFITYFAYTFYDLISQLTAFCLMVIFTVFTVFASLIYDRQIIAHIGLVGAYAVPFLLSSGSGRVDILFSYIAIINIGILAVSVKKYWKPLFYTSFGFTWLIYSAWYANNYLYNEHFLLSLIFLTVFFLIFYFTFIAYKIVQKEPFKIENVGLVLSNSFIHFGLGYSILDTSIWKEFLGLFTVFNAAIHFAVGFIIYKLKLGTQTAFYLIVALVLTFLTIAVPVQFNGNYITLLWMAEAVFLFVIGRTQKITLFEYFSYPLMVFTCISLLLDWQNAYLNYPNEIENAIYPFINSNFVTSIFVTVGFGIICYVNFEKRFDIKIDESIYEFVKYAIPGVFLVILYNTFRIEISNYFQYEELFTAIKPLEPTFNYAENSITNESLSLFNFIFQLNYTMIFLYALSFVNIQKIKNATLGFVNLILNSFVLAIFLTFGLIVLSILSFQYLNQTDSNPFKPSVFYITIRYVSFGFVATLIYSSYQYIKQDFLIKYISGKKLLIAFDTTFYFSLLLILSSELLNWSEIFGWDEIYKLGLSILFGLFALFLIVLGIVQKKKHLRIFAIVLFAITLVKLFVYDLAELGTISKTVVFVSIGILLLIASFLYTKYKDLIFDDNTE